MSLLSLTATEFCQFVFQNIILNNYHINNYISVIMCYESKYCAYFIVKYVSQYVNFAVRKFYIILHKKDN
jgi:hypothetical protein